MGSCLSADGGGSPRESSPSSPVASGGRRSRRGHRKKPSYRSSSKREEHVYRIPGRMFMNGASRSASLYTQQGKKGPNQDAMIVWENFGSRNDTVFCGVFDGHGPHGHMVARRVKDVLPQKLIASLEGEEWITPESSSTVSTMEEPRASVDLEGKEEYSQIFKNLKNSFLKAYSITDEELKQQPDIDCLYSGSTAVTLVKQGEELVIGNIGDSRVILGTKDQNNSMTAIQLTVDLKPNLPNEAERIKSCRGRVFALRDEPDVHRVWLPNYDVPGLAMARAFGDFCLKDYGLISVPEISYRQITERDEFVVLATDGLWDVLSNQEVVDIVASAPARSSAASLLVESAVKAWKLKYPTSRTDDCAVVCLFLHTETPYISPSPAQAEFPESPNATASTTETGVCNKELFSARSDSSFDSVQRDDWSVPEGVSRVETILSVPRFLPANEQPQDPKTSSTS